MTLERSRRLIGGVWQYVTATEDGGGGSLPPGGSTGEVLAKQSNADGDVGWDPGGGSQPEAVRRLSFDLDFATDFLAGPITLYTPDAGEIAGPVMLRDFTVTDNNGVSVGRDETVVDDNNFPPLAQFDSSSATDSFHVGTGADLLIVPTTNGPVIAGWADNIAGNPNAYPWQANHAYDGSYGAAVSGQMVIEVGHIWVADTGGTSGGSEPDFAGNIGGTVADNDLIWTDNGPCEGAATVLLDVRAAS